MTDRLTDEQVERMGLRPPGPENGYRWSDAQVVSLAREVQEWRSAFPYGLETTQRLLSAQREQLGELDALRPVCPSTYHSDAFAWSHAANGLTVPCDEPNCDGGKMPLDAWVKLLISTLRDGIERTGGFVDRADAVLKMAGES